MPVNIPMWLKEVASLLENLADIDFGYPLGKNEIRFPDHPQEARKFFSRFNESILGEMIAFYESCDGLSWPDVRNGYFLESLERLMTAEQRGEPEVLAICASNTLHRVIVVGTDGGGGRFCFDIQNGGVFHVAAGLLANRRLEADASQLRKVGDTFGEFLLRLKGDLAAFIADDPSHEFMI